MVDIEVEVSRLVGESISSGLFPGAVWSVEEKGVVTARGAAGHAEIGGNRRRMAEGTIFDLASLTKPVVCGTLCLILWERGEISLEDPVGRCLPAFGGGWRNRVSVAQVLSHSSGLPPGLDLGRICQNPGGVLEAICSASMEYEPGSRTLYSDVGFILLGKLLERKTGIPLESLANKEIFEPLGMKRTMYLPSKDLRRQIAATEDSPERGRILVGEVHDGNAFFMGGVSGHAGLFSCLDDLSAFCRMMLGYGQGILSRNTISEATGTWSEDEGSAYGLSWFKRRSPINPASHRFSGRAYGHTGYTGTSLWIDPARELFAILLTNRVHPHRAPGRIPEMNRTRRAFHDIAAGSTLS